MYFEFQAQQLPIILWGWGLLQWSTVRSRRSTSLGAREAIPLEYRCESTSMAQLLLWKMFLIFDVIPALELNTPITLTEKEPFSFSVSLEINC